MEVLARNPDEVAIRGIEPGTNVALVEPGSCFAGTLAELVLATDRSYMLIGQREGDNKPPAVVAP